MSEPVSELMSKSVLEFKFAFEHNLETKLTWKHDCGPRAFSWVNDQTDERSPSVEVYVRFWVSESQPEVLTLSEIIDIMISVIFYN